MVVGSVFKKVVIEFFVTKVRCGGGGGEKMKLEVRLRLNVEGFGVLGVRELVRFFGRGAKWISI